MHILVKTIFRQDDAIGEFVLDFGSPFFHELFLISLVSPKNYQTFTASFSEGGERGSAAFAIADLTRPANISVSTAMIRKRKET